MSILNAVKIYLYRSFNRMALVSGHLKASYPQDWRERPLFLSSSIRKFPWCEDLGAYMCASLGMRQGKIELNNWSHIGYEPEPLWKALLLMQSSSCQSSTRTVHSRTRQAVLPRRC